MKEYNLFEAAENVAQKRGLDTNQVLGIGKDLIDDFKRQLMNLDEIHITGFGSFTVKTRSVPARLFSGDRKKKLKIKFNASDKLEDSINEANL